MMTILRKSLATSGALTIANATLVTGPTGQSVIWPGFSFAMRMMRSLACSSVGLDLRLRKLDVADRIRAVDVIGAADIRVNERTRDASGDGDIPPAKEFQHTQRIVGGDRGVGVAEGRRESLEFYAGAGGRRRKSPWRRRCRGRHR